VEENRIPKRVLYMNLETRPTDRPRNRWQDEVREGGWKKLLIMARNHHILHMPTKYNRIHRDVHHFSA
jgi:hypothetical protein